jgi:serine/threonine protein kinase
MQENLLVADDGTALLSDIGSSSLTDDGLHCHEPHLLKLTSTHWSALRYRPKELWASKENPSPKPTRSSDVYALGCVTYEVKLSLVSPPVVVQLLNVSR